MARTNDEIATYMWFYSKIAVYKGLFDQIKGESKEDKESKQDLARNLLKSIGIYKRAVSLPLRQNTALIDVNKLEKICKSLLPEYNKDVSYM